ncbi:hypothetical protein N7474_004668 [Penicillium riverlandense]|uniref:uncharacterized protein n=1 Tax=Penicillium riverlandense TaxID=1903569 RepID=UPI0025479817|nr:uncharacterized protein N7474_004668 [Penicillium riverlandense]KAJ5819077.1 hypothetical protein N7474_004668 [Penicillium riverlandense]
MDPNPIRVLVIVSQRSSRWNKAQNRAEDLVPSAIRLLQNKNPGNGFHATVSDTKLLAIQKWRTRTFIVFDICNTAYDAKLGHLPEQNQLPVVVAHFSRKQSAYMANAWISNRVNRDIALLHNANGFGAVPPYVEDWGLGKLPQYRNPRDMSLL